MNLFKEVIKAKRRIHPYIRKTPLEFSPYLSKQYETNVYLKLESEQLTGSFKIRGAFNKFLACRKQLDNGFITASTGNHGKAVGYVSQMLKIKGKVFVPKDTQKNKLEGINRYDMAIEKIEGTSREVEIVARRFAEIHKIPFISPYNDLDIIAGQGTLGCEILKDLPDVDMVFACIGAGGLIAAVAAYLKNKKKITLVGCEPKNSCAMSASIGAGKVVDVKHKPTLSDGSAGGIEPGAITFDFCRQYVDDYIQVSESEIKRSMVRMMDKHRKIIEGAAAVPLASLKKKKLKKNVVVILSGSGVGLQTLKTVLGE